MNEQTMDAVIIAGGKGTRMGNISLPKSLLPIDNIPILQHQINLLNKYNIKKKFILSEYLSDKITNYITANNIKDTYNIKEPEPLGTAGALKNFEKWQSQNNIKISNPFLILYGDKMINIKLDKFIKYHNIKNSDCTIAVHKTSHMYDSDLVETNDDMMITCFHSKSRKAGYYQNLASIALFITSTKIFDELELRFSDLGKDIFPKVLNNYNFYAYLTLEYSKDIGTKERYKQVQNDYKYQKIKSYEDKQNAFFIDRDGVVNQVVEMGVAITQDKFKMINKVSEAIKMINDSGYLAILITNQPHIAKGFMTLEDLRDTHNKMETLLGCKQAKIDAIYCCPHHPEKGWEGEVKDLKIDCNCRKPKPGMIIQAAKDHNINLKESYIIGDSWVDVTCGKNAGVTTVCVKDGGGEECSLCSEHDEPDYYYDSFYEAVKLLLEKEWNR